MGEDDLLDMMDIPDRLGTNADLEAFRQTSDAGQTSAPRRTRTTGSCHVCDAATQNECLRCERPACTRHHHVMYGLCTVCAHGKKQDEDDGLPPSGLDIPWIG